MAKPTEMIMDNGDDSQPIDPARLMAAVAVATPGPDGMCHVNVSRCAPLWDGYRPAAELRERFMDDLDAAREKLAPRLKDRGPDDPDFRDVLAEFAEKVWHVAYVFGQCEIVDLVEEIAREQEGEVPANG